MEYPRGASVICVLISCICLVLGHLAIAFRFSHTNPRSNHGIIESIKKCENLNPTLLQHDIGRGVQI